MAVAICLLFLHPRQGKAVSNLSDPAGFYRLVYPMSTIYSLDPSKGIVIAIWDGVVTAEEWHQSFSEFLAETELHTIWRVLVDVQGVTNDLSVTKADIENITGTFGN